MTQYDPTILQTFANRLYARANSIIAAYALFGIVLGSIGGWYVSTLTSGSGPLVIALLAILFGAMGYTIGSGRAFMLKFQAQQALCQRQIEANTRAVSRAEAVLTEPRVAAPPMVRSAS